jgi:AAA+ ATPase superfamily predicted ATPase
MRYVGVGPHTLYLEELQWLSCYDDELISDFKIAWDNYLRHNKDLIVVLCGSSPSFMASHVIKSKAIYGRSQHQMHVKPFTLEECRAYFGEDFSDSAVMDAYLTVGGIPEYLSYLRRSKSPYLELCREAFTPNGYFFNECERIFVSSLANNPHYRKILDMLARERFLTRSEIASQLKIEAGGTLSELLHELEATSFVNRYVPFNKKEGSKLVRYEIGDPYLQFYFKFVASQAKKIRNGMFQDNPTKALNLTDYQQWLGYSFERWCRSNHQQLARRLGFGAVNYDVGPFFSRSTPSNFQMDLVFRRADRVITIMELKYSRAPAPKSVIQEFERKLDLFDVPPRHSVERVLVAVSGCEQSVIDAGYFDEILTLKDLMTDSPR